jgi:peroxiredoxin
MRFAPFVLVVLALAAGCRTTRKTNPREEPPNPVAKKLSKPKLALTKSQPAAPPSAPPGTPRPKPVEPGTAAPAAAATAPAAAPVAANPAPAAASPAPVATAPAAAPAAPEPAAAAPAQPAPAPETTAPVAAQPAPPAAEPAQPAPAPVPPPAPAAAAPAQPAPAPAQPAPAQTAAPQPAPAAAQPMSAHAEAAAPAGQMAPAPVRPAPADAKSAPADAKSAPAEPAPKPAAAAPLPAAPAQPRTAGTKPGNLVAAFDATVRRTISGSPVESTLASQKAAKVTVYLVTSTTCPYCRDYAKRVAALEEQYMAKGVDVVHVYPNRTESTEAKLGWHAQQGFRGGIVVDADAKVARALAADRTPTAFVVDAAGVIVYRGAIDDSPAGDAVHQRYLADAIDAALAGRAVAVPSTDPSGCATEY